MHKYSAYTLYKSVDWRIYRKITKRNHFQKISISNVLKSLGNERIQICQISRFNHRIKRSEMIFHDDTRRVVATRIFLPVSHTGFQSTIKAIASKLDRYPRQANNTLQQENRLFPFRTMKLEQSRATGGTKSSDPSTEPCHPIIRSTFNHRISAHQTFLMQFPVWLIMKSGS